MSKKDAEKVYGPESKPAYAVVAAMPLLVVLVAGVTPAPTAEADQLMVNWFKLTPDPSSSLAFRAFPWSTKGVALLPALIARVVTLGVTSPAAQITRSVLLSRSATQRLLLGSKVMPSGLKRCAPAAS